MASKKPRKNRVRMAQASLALNVAILELIQTRLENSPTVHADLLRCYRAPWGTWVGRESLRTRIFPFDSPHLDTEIPKPRSARISRAVRWRKQRARSEYYGRFLWGFDVKVPPPTGDGLCIQPSFIPITSTARSIVNHLYECIAGVVNWVEPYPIHLLMIDARHKVNQLWDMIQVGLQVADQLAYSNLDPIKKEVPLPEDLATYLCGFNGELLAVTGPTLNKQSPLRSTLYTALKSGEKLPAGFRRTQTLRLGNYEIRLVKNCTKFEH